MRGFAGLMAAAFLMTPLAAMAQTPVGYDVAAAPASHRGQVTEVNGVRTFTADNGWYTMALGPDDTTDLDKGKRYFTYGRSDKGHYVDILVVTDTIKPGEAVMTLDDVEAGIGDMISATARPAFLGDLYVSERKIITLGDGNGHQPMQFAVWIGKDPKSPDTVTVIGGTLLPKGSLMVMIDADTAVDAEAALRDHLRIASGTLE